MHLDYLLLKNGINPDTESIFIDANIAYLAHPSQIRRYRYHMTQGCVNEIEKWGRVQLARGQSDFLDALKKIDPEIFLRDILHDRLFDNALRYERASVAVKEMEQGRLVVADKKIHPAISQIGMMGGKRLAAEAAKNYMKSWDPTSDLDWKKQQIEIAVSYARVRYYKMIRDMNLDSHAWYFFTRQDRIMNIRRHVGYFFQDFMANPQVAYEKANGGERENEVDQSMISTACAFRPWGRDHKKGSAVVIITKDIDLIEMVADLCAYQPRLISKVRVICPDRTNDRTNSGAH